MEYRKCEALEIKKVKLCCAISIHHKLAYKDKLSIEDLYGENLMLIRRGWSSHIDKLRDFILNNHRDINIVDFKLSDEDMAAIAKLDTDKSVVFNLRAPEVIENIVNLKRNV